MKKYGVLLNMINNFITFFPRYYIYLGALLSLLSLKPKEIKIILEVRQQDNFPNHIMKSDSDENLNNFLRIW